MEIILLEKVVNVGGIGVRVRGKSGDARTEVVRQGEARGAAAA
jgi:hypothetical protein